jgi:hypothetical protein
MPNACFQHSNLIRHSSFIIHHSSFIIFFYPTYLIDSTTGRRDASIAGNTALINPINNAAPTRANGIHGLGSGSR